MSVFKIIFIFALFWSTYLSALDIGKKLTVEIMEVSQSQKTIRVNRGTEDGLGQGDHAKFFLTQSIICRAVLVSAKSRSSVWSVYRLVQPRLIKRNEVMNIKITQAVNLTKKKPHNLVSDSSATVRLDQSANGDYVAYSDLIKPEQKDFDLGGGVVPKIKSESVISSRIKSTNLSRKWIELWTQLGFHYYQSSVQTSAAQNFSANEFFNQFMGGFEVYLGRLFSIQGNGQYLQESLLSYDGAITDSALIEYGGSLQFYIKNPHRSNSTILYLTGGASMGKIVDAFAGGANSPVGSQNTQEARGSTFSMNAGLGLKYHLRSGFGFRMLLDFYQRKDTFEVAANVPNSWTRIKRGPRLMLGFSLRF